MSDHRFHRRTAFEQSARLGAQTLDPTAVEALHPGHLHTLIVQINNGGVGLWSAFNVLHQDRGLFDLPGKGVAVVGVAGKGPRADDQVASFGGGNVHLDAEFIGLARFALADALDFRCVRGVQLVLVLGPLGVDAPSPVEPQGGDLLDAVSHLRQAAFLVTDDPAQGRPLAFEHPAQALELLAWA